MSEFQLVDGDINILEELSENRVVDFDRWWREIQGAIVQHSVMDADLLVFDERCELGTGRRGIIFPGFLGNGFTTCETVVNVNAKL